MVKPVYSLQDRIMIEKKLLWKLSIVIIIIIIIIMHECHWRSVSPGTSRPKIRIDMCEFRMKRII
jgi:hypothetical protein